jgi:hypothetical protein
VGHFRANSKALAEGEPDGTNHVSFCLGRGEPIVPKWTGDASVQVISWEGLA